MFLYAFVFVAGFRDSPYLVRLLPLVLLGLCVLCQQLNLKITDVLNLQVGGLREASIALEHMVGTVDRAVVGVTLTSMRQHLKVGAN